jgi:UDP-glucose 4-epimerase
VYNTENEIINIGSDVETTILDVAHQIMELMNIDYTTLRLEDGQVGSTPRRVPDITKLQSLVSNFVYISLKEGLKKCL